MRGLSRLRRRLTDERGYTLIELLVTLSILGLVMGGLTVVFVSGSSAERRLNDRFRAQSNARIAVDRLRRELRSACGAGTANANLVQFAFSPNCAGGTTTPTVTWCTAGSGSRYALYRVASSTATCTGGVQLIDYLTSGAVFTFTAKNTPAGSFTLPRLHVDLLVNVTPSDARNRFELVDDIVLRNSARS
jgi:prepilin-type N-terminal cleavage/methylation domain-containing protein